MKKMVSSLLCAVIVFTFFPNFTVTAGAETQLPVVITFHTNSPDGTLAQWEVRSQLLAAGVLKELYFGMEECGPFSAEFDPSVTSIGPSAFEDRDGLEGVFTSGGVIDIGDNAFSHCVGLENATLNGVARIGSFAFDFCIGLSDVDLGRDLENIGRGAFENCIKLEGVVIPDSAVEISERAFRGCMCLKDILVGSSHEYYSSDDGVLFDKGKKTIHTYPAGKDSDVYSLPNSIVKIGDWAFSDCVKLRDIIIPESVTHIGGYAFYFCSGLRSVDMPNSISIIDQDAFAYCTSLTAVTIPYGVTEIAFDTFAGCSALKSIVIPESVTRIGSRAFWRCASLDAIVIPKSVNRISDLAFMDCASLREIYFNGDAPEMDWGVIPPVSYPAVYVYPDAKGFPAEGQLWKGCIVEYRSVGVGVSGRVMSFNPKNLTIIRLMQDDREMYHTTIPAMAGSGRVDQAFSFENVAPGVYSLVVTKTGHTSFTKKSLVVIGNSTSASEPLVVTLAGGDVNDDGVINATDLTQLLSEFNKAPINYPNADIDGNGIVNASDLTYLLAGFNKHNEVIE